MTVEMVAPVELERSNRMSKNLHFIRIDAFEPACVVPGAGRDAYCRRFTTLFLDESSARSGGVGEVVRAVNAFGEQFALKRLSADAAADNDDLAAMMRAAFDAEYDTHRKLSELRGFPRLYGRGTLDGSPVLVMEWIDGITLEQAAKELAVDDAGRVSPLVAARIGRDLYDLLSRMALLHQGLAHRDVSLRNVMVDTSHQSLQDQVEEGSFELRLIDFGSATIVTGDDPTFTSRYGGQRGATADFAPPEMLTEDVAEMERLRHSPAVDVYSAGSVLYTLLEGHPPYDLSYVARAELGNRSAFRIKTELAYPAASGAHGAADDIAAVLEREPEVAVAVARAATALENPPSESALRLALSQVDEQLTPYLAAALAVHQAKRPTAADMRDALAAFAEGYSENVARALKGEPQQSFPLAGEVAALAAARRRKRGRRLFAGLSALVCIAVAAVTGLLANGLEYALPASSPVVEGPLPGVAVALALLVPAGLGLAARHGEGSTSFGLACGLLGDLLGGALVAIAVAISRWPSVGVEMALYAAVLLAALAVLPAFVASFVFADPSRKSAGFAAVKRPVLPWGADPVPYLEGGSSSAALPSAARALKVAEEPVYELDSAEEATALEVEADESGAGEEPLEEAVVVVEEEALP